MGFLKKVGKFVKKSVKKVSKLANNKLVGTALNFIPVLLISQRSSQRWLRMDKKLMLARLIRLLLLCRLMPL